MAGSSASELVASIVVSHATADVVGALTAANTHFADPLFEDMVADVLRSRPDLVDRWVRYSGDQRWTPAAYVDGTEAGWYDSGRQDVVQHRDEAAAVADFIHRTAAYLHADRRGR